MQNNNQLPTRKNNRLEYYDYGTAGVYFLTICTVKRQNYFWKNVGATIGRPQNMELSPYGKIVDESINTISSIYPSVSVKQHIIMPDHVHLMIFIRPDEYGRPMVAPTLSRIVQQLKGYVTKRIGTSVWQRSFYDHVIRNRKDYDEHLKYMYENPIKLYYEVKDKFNDR